MESFYQNLRSKSQELHLRWKHLEENDKPAAWGIRIICFIFLVWVTALLDVVFTSTLNVGIFVVINVIFLTCFIWGCSKSGTISKAKKGTRAPRIMVILFVFVFGGCSSVAFWYLVESFGKTSPTPPVPGNVSVNPAPEVVPSVPQPALQLPKRTEEAPLSAVTPESNPTGSSFAPTQPSGDTNSGFDLNAITQEAFANQAKKKADEIEAQHQLARDQKTAAADLPPFLISTMDSIQSCLNDVATQSGDSLVSDYKEKPSTIPFGGGAGPPSLVYRLSFKEKVKWNFMCSLYRALQGGGVTIQALTVDQIGAPLSVQTAPVLVASFGIVFQQDTASYSIEVKDGQDSIYRRTCTKTEFEACMREALRKFVGARFLRENN